MKELFFEKIWSSDGFSKQSFQSLRRHWYLCVVQTETKRGRNGECPNSCYQTMLLFSRSAPCHPQLQAVMIGTLLPWEVLNDAFFPFRKNSIEEIRFSSCRVETSFALERKKVEIPQAGEIYNSLKPRRLPLCSSMTLGSKTSKENASLGIQDWIINNRWQGSNWGGPIMDDKGFLQCLGTL